MKDTFEINYQLSIDDYLAHQENIFLSNKNPSVRDSVQRWIRLSFILIVLVYPAIVWLLTHSVVLTLVMLIAAAVLFFFLQKNAAKSYWYCYKGKARKDLLQTYFNNNEAQKIPMTAYFQEDTLTIISETASKKINRKDIDNLKISPVSIFFYTTKHEASYILLEGIENKEQVLNWFREKEV
ncbi:hypothetical protein [Enterococcus sp. LJL51]|uniref:hypothetical protein n=1 Tax=Enterococcus sp. LJL51 TaxID=3416656 RepID=UPI003CF76A59